MATEAEIRAEIDSYIRDNNEKYITPARLRSILVKVIDWVSDFFMAEIQSQFDALEADINTAFSLLETQITDDFADLSASVSSNFTTLSNLLTTQYGNVNIQVLTNSGSTVSWNVTSGNIATLTLTGNWSLNALTGMVAGQYYKLLLKQDATGSRTFTIPTTYYVVDGGAGVVPISAAANARMIITFMYDGTDMWVEYGENYSKL